MIDLHTHTTYSDGRDDVITLLKKAEEMGLECLSITDHSTCEAYKELKNIDITKYYKGRLLTGCELFTTINGVTIELLGYGIDTVLLNKELPNMYKYAMNDTNVYETKKLIEICDALGIKIDKDNIEYDFKVEFGSKQIHNKIIENPENRKFFDDESAWKSNYVFYRECMCNPSSKFFIDKSEFFPKAEDVIKLIKQANGLVFIPHIFVYGENSLNILKQLTTNYDIDGMECYYTVFTSKQTEYLLDFCKERNYYISGGSDYHGSRKPDFHLGKGKGNLNIPYDVIKEWI